MANKQNVSLKMWRADSSSDEEEEKIKSKPSSSSRLIKFATDYVHRK
jgi:hypothetical protein